MGTLLSFAIVYMFGAWVQLAVEDGLEGMALIHGLVTLAGLAAIVVLVIRGLGI